ncbi:hypothetical protein EAH72_08945 [Pseudomonas caspiana]|nr:hypothetical protein EAH72_08945 [Pseudomonas caspiana]
MKAPIPARYVIGQDGLIRYAEVNPDYTQRPEPDAMLDAIRGRTDQMPPDPRHVLSRSVQ